MRHVSGVRSGTASQDEFMEKDTCILVNEVDDILGSASKAEAHRFNPKQPHGMLHRAFSVFLFDSQKRLLLQRRADSKITFPGVWTNTCCSHQLYGYDPPEVNKKKYPGSAVCTGFFTTPPESIPILTTAKTPRPVPKSAYLQITSFFSSPSRVTRTHLGFRLGKPLCVFAFMVHC